VRADSALAWLSRGWTPRIRLLTSIGGYAVMALTIAWAFSNKGVGTDLFTWERVGAEVRSGVSPYYATNPVLTFYYAPPWALIFGATTWLPQPVLIGLIFAIELASLRFIAGSWQRVGYFGLIPITGGELAASQFNLLVAAGIAMAMLGDGRLAVLTALAKLSPALAIREWRRSIVVLAVLVAVTIPVAAWWADWIRSLQYASSQDYGFPVPVVWRWALAGLLILRFPRSRPIGGLAAAIAIPGLYSYSLVLLYPLAVYVADRGRRLAARPAS
jgi:hypothetical protein